MHPHGRAVFFDCRGLFRLARHLIRGVALLLLLGHLPALAVPDVGRLDQGLVRVVVRTEDGLAAGTGFVVNQDGHVVTNHHVVEGGSTVAVFPAGSATPYPARPDEVFPHHDLTVLQAEGLRRNPFCPVR